MRRIPIAAFCCAALFTACGRKAPTPAPEPAGTAIPSSDTPRVGGDRAGPGRAGGAGERINSDSTNRDGRDRRAVLAEPIRFEFDRYDLSEDARITLDLKIGVLQAEPTLRIRVEGHADERGSDEYNVALAMRRASAARRYLLQHGIADDRVDVVSLGEERSICQDAEEACWRLNRRAEFVITAP